MSVKKKIERLAKVERNARKTIKGLVNMLYSKRVRLAYRNVAKRHDEIKSLANVSTGNNFGSSCSVGDFLKTSALSEETFLCKLITQV